MKTLITVILVYIQVIMCAGFPSSFNGVPNAQNPEETVRGILEIIARTFSNSNNAQNAQFPVYNFQANRYIQNANYNGLPNNQTNAMQVQQMNFYNPQTNQAPINAQIREKTAVLEYLKNIQNRTELLVIQNPVVTTPEQEELKELIRQTDQFCQKLTIQLAEQNLRQMQQIVSQQVTGAVTHAQQPTLFRETNMLPAMNALPRAPILPQPVVRAAQNTSVLQTPLNNTMSIPANRTVRTISSTDSSQASSSRVPGINVPLAIQPNPVRTDNMHGQRETLISDQFLRAWKTRTLNDENRDGFREQYNRVICLPDGGIEQNRNQQPGVENAKETLKKRIDACNPGQNIWEVVLKLLSFKGNKYTEFDTIYENRQLYNAKLNQFVGYYDGFFKDLVGYMRQHGLVLYTKEDNIKLLNEDVRKNTIADMYTKKSLDVPKMQECMKRSSADFKAFPLLNRIRTVLSIPEVYEDLSSIPDVLFRRIVASMEESKEISKKIEIVKSLHAIAHHTEKKLLNYQRVPFSDNLLQYFHNIANNEATSPEYRVDKMYLEAYDAMVLFYKHAPYCYYNDAGALQRVKGKDMIIKQEYKQCEALIDIAHNENGQIKPRLTSQKSSTVTDYCDASFEHPNHYHVQFVDNSYQAVRRVCVPFLSANERTYYVHTIEDIMKYLKDLYDIQEEGCIYALKTRIMQQRFSQHSWSFISEGDKKKTIDVLSKEEYRVVFYHLQKETLDKFTLSIFKRPHYDREREKIYRCKAMPEIPLFLSPFMQCAMQLSPFETVGEHGTLTEKDLQHSFIQPSVYRYSRPVDATTEMSFTQVENYYSVFYLDKDIFKTYDFCHTLQDSASQESATSCRLTWYIRTPKNPDEYTHYVFLDNQRDMFLKDKCTLYDISFSIFTRNYAENKLVYTFCGCEYMQNRKNSILLDNELKNRLNTKGYPNRVIMDDFYKLFVVKSIDISKSGLVIHNEIQAVLLNTLHN